MTYSIKNYNINYSNLWDEICLNSANGTFLQSMNFLSYHKNKFDDKSIMIFKDEKCVGVFPAARDPSNKNYLHSHPGITFGGLVHISKIQGYEIIKIFHLMREHYLKEGFTNIIYKPTPSFYHKSPSHDDIYALQILKAERYRCDISATLDLERELCFYARRKRGIKKAKKNKIEISENFKHINEFWKVLTENLKEKYDSKPVHNVEEINEIYERFPSSIKCIFALDNKKVTGGILLFIHKNVVHTQYISANKEGRNNSSLDYIFDYTIKKYKEKKFRWFDFGISTENEGLELNDGLFKYKREFGSGSTIYEFYNWTL